MNRSSRVALENSLRQAKEAVAWDRENVEAARRSLERYKYGLAANTHVVRELETTLKEDK